MCRHVAYLGPAAPLSQLLYDPPHALAQQAAAPRDMRGGGTINADGFGVGWFPHPDAAPVRYRRHQPIWSDADLPDLAAATASGAVLAAVRSATPGMPVTEAACAPFSAGPGEQWLFSLNGRVAGWPHSVAGLASQLPTAELLALPAQTDSVLLWALLRRRLAQGGSPPAAVAALVVDVLSAAPGSRLNLLLTGPDVIVATVVTHSLSVRHRGGATFVSSEPLDDHPAWRPVPDHTLLVATRESLDESALAPAAALAKGA